MTDFMSCSRITPYSTGFTCSFSGPCSPCRRRMFAKRTGHGEKCANAADDQRSPIFLQFLDCVWQLMAQQPSAFEFNAAFLGSIMDEVLSCRYGTFLYNCEREREQAALHDKTVSVWDGLLTAAGMLAADGTDAVARARYLNPFYDRRLSGFGAESPFLRADWTPSIRNAKLWPYHARWNAQMTVDFQRADVGCMAVDEIQVSNLPSGRPRTLPRVTLACSHRF